MPSVAAALALGILAGDPESDAHWAYRPPERAPLPPDSSGGWAKNPIDLFIAARLAREGLAPAPEAAREELQRRASLDLTGLPPALDELERFLTDTAPGAWERAVDRLLASPHYGEHQARAWLDSARYADSRGYEKDERREMWRYRDWVIEAFDRDLAFDRFTLEQLAGDLLPEPTLDQLVATGFHRNTLVNEEGGTDPEEFRVAAVKDRVNTTALVWLGTTLECAQCHDHKYDPFTQTEYYRLYAFFDGTEDTGNSDAPAIPAPTREHAERARLLEREKAELSARLEPAALEPELAPWRAAWAGVAWDVLRPVAFEARQGSRLALLDDGSLLAVGAPGETDDYVVRARIGPGTVAALRLEVLTDDSLPERGPGRAGHRNFVLSELELALDGAPLAFRSARADHEQPGYEAAQAADGAAETGWAIGGGQGESHALVVELSAPLALERERELEAVLLQRHGGQHLIGRLRLSVAERAPPELDPVPAPELGPLLGSAVPEERARVSAWYSGKAPTLAPVRARLQAIERELVPPSALVMRELPGGRRTHVQQRGNFLAPGAEVTPGVPAVLPPLESASERPTRLDLARWLVDGRNPLTARVTVNRVWQRLFGTGLVATDNDFGTRGEPPSHPELLDWLALEFQERGWSTKALLRLILTSAAYRQSSRCMPELLERDPENRLLARGAKLRLDAEAVRDVALRASGLLCEWIGGPSVFPPQPEGTWQSPYSGDRWVESAGDDRHRRGLYTFLKRSTPYPTFLLFDSTSRELACTRRARSDTPLQALALLNDPAFVECAQALGERMCREGGASAEERIRHGFRLCTAREPDGEELAILLRLLEAERGRAEGGELDPERAAWAAVASVLLNLDETITKS